MEPPCRWFVKGSIYGVQCSITNCPKCGKYVDGGGCEDGKVSESAEKATQTDNYPAPEDSRPHYLMHDTITGHAS